MDVPARREKLALQYGRRLEASWKLALRMGVA
jgi:hypothetical protein